MQYAFSLPTKANKVPAGSDWIHEIKHDGYRMMVIREQDRVRLISRGGYDWADRFPLIVSAALKLPEEHFVIDGEVVVLKKDGVSDFDALSSRKHDKRAMLYAFDMLAGDGEDLRAWPLSLRKSALAGAALCSRGRLFHRRVRTGRHWRRSIPRRVQHGTRGHCLEALDHGYCAGRCKHWIKVKNSAHPAYSRVRDFHQSARSRRSA